MYFGTWTRCSTNCQGFNPMIHREGKKLRRGESIIAGCRTVPQEISCQLVSAILTRYSGLSMGCQKLWTGHRLYGPFHLVSLVTCRCPTQRSVLGHKSPKPLLFVQCQLLFSDRLFTNVCVFFVINPATEDKCLFQEIRRALGRGPHLYCPAPGGHYCASQHQEWRVEASRSGVPIWHMSV